jgi:hypothetical protein
VPIGNMKRLIRSGVPFALVLTIALVLIPVGASADSSGSPVLSVCNTAAGNGQGGGMVVDEGDSQGALHNSDNLTARKNLNLNAASHSRALATCYVPQESSAGGATT